MSVRSRAMLMGIALTIAVGPPAMAADAMTAFDEFSLKSSAILQCHAAQSEAEQAFLGRADAVRKAAVEQLWARLDMINPARHDENGRRAEQTLQLRREAHDRFIQSQVTEYGCAWLDGNFYPPPR